MAPVLTVGPHDMNKQDRLTVADPPKRDMISIRDTLEVHKSPHTALFKHQIDYSRLRLVFDT
jgi:hypothetical protein